MVAAPCRAFVYAARWNGSPPQTTTGAASVSTSHCQLSNWSAGTIDSRTTGAASSAETTRRSRSAASSGSRRRAGSSSAEASRSSGDGGGSGGGGSSAV